MTEREHTAEEEYRQKADCLATYYEQVTPYEFYRDIFPEGSLEREGHPEDGKPNAMLTIIDGERAYNRLVFDDLAEIAAAQDKPFAIMSPVSYYGRERTAAKSSYLHGIAIDVDDVGLMQLHAMLSQLEHDILPKATYVVNSGHGLHIYYVFQDPIPLYRSVQARLRTFKYNLTRSIWNAYTSRIKEPQYQGIYQGFRMPGAQSKLGPQYPVTAYRMGEKVTIEYINKYLPKEKQLHDVNYKSSCSLKEAKTRFPEWYERRIEHDESRGRWKVDRAVYDWWKKKIETEAHVGHRYFCIAALAAYARKCKASEDELQNEDILKHRVSAEELRNDMKHIQARFNLENPDIPFTDDDVEAALNFYVDDFIRYPRSVIERTTGISIPPNRRNHAKQSDHLEEARALRDIRMRRKGKKWTDGNGRPDKCDTVQAWRKAHPDGRKADCIRDTGLDKKTVYKWWEA